MYNFYLGEELLPITPPKLTTTHDGNNKVYNLINDTDINLPKPTKLLEYSFRCCIPHQLYPFAQPTNASKLKLLLPQIDSIFPFDNFASLFKPQSYWIKYFSELHQSQSPFVFRVERYIGRNNKNNFTGIANINIDTTTGEITNTAYNTRMHVTLENYTIIEDAGDAQAGLDILVDIHLKQAVQYGTQKYTLTAQTDENGNPVTDDNGNQKYDATPEINREVWDDAEVFTRSDDIITVRENLFNNLMYG